MNNIEILEELKDKQFTRETLISLYKFYYEEFKPYVLSTEERDALENLIKEYKELKEENNKLKSCDGIFDVFRAGKESSRQRIEFDYIPKSKIKEKIEGYDKMIKATYDDITYQGVYRRKICFEIRQILQELLEGE